MYPCTKAPTTLHTILHSAQPSVLCTRRTVHISACSVLQKHLWKMWQHPLCLSLLFPVCTCSRLILNTLLLCECGVHGKVFSPIKPQGLPAHERRLHCCFSSSTTALLLFLLLLCLLLLCLLLRSGCMHTIITALLLFFLFVCALYPTVACCTTLFPSCGTLLRLLRFSLMFCVLRALFQVGVQGLYKCVTPEMQGDVLFCSILFKGT